MQIDPNDKFMSPSTTSRILLGIKNLLHLWLENCRERFVQVRGNGMKAGLNDHLLRDIGHEDVSPASGRIAERCKARIHAFKMQLLRTP